MLLTPRPDSKASPKIAHMPLRGRTRRIDSYKAKRQPRSKKRVTKHHPQPSHKERTNSRETEVQATTAKQNNSPGARNGQRRPVRCAPEARDQQRNTAPQARGTSNETPPLAQPQRRNRRLRNKRAQKGGWPVPKNRPFVTPRRTRVPPRGETPINRGRARVIEESANVSCEAARFRRRLRLQEQSRGSRRQPRWSPCRP